MGFTSGIEVKVGYLDEYPVRYTAFEREDIIWVNPSLRRMEGNEWAIYHRSVESGKFPGLYNSMHCEIISFRDKHLLLECRADNRDSLSYPTNGSAISYSMEYVYSDFQLALDVMGMWIKEHWGYIEGKI